MKKKEFNPQHTVSIEWDELRAEFASVMAGKNVASQPNFTYYCDQMRRAKQTRSSFIGNTTGEIERMIREGFYPPEFKDVDALVQHAHRPEIVWSEEGENIDICAALSGDDDPFFQYEEERTRPGLSVLIDLDFSAFVDAKVIQAYGAFVAATLHALEESGYDLEIGIRQRSRELLVNNSRQQCVQLRVKREGEPREFSEWSVLFAPGGFRTLCFTALAMASNKMGNGKITDYLGIPDGEKAWTVSFEEQQRILSLTCDSGAQAFPTDQMQKQLRATGLVS